MLEISERIELCRSVTMTVVLKVNSLNLGKAFDEGPELADDLVGDSAGADDDDDVHDERVLSLSDMNYRKHFAIGCNSGHVVNHNVHLGHGLMNYCTYFALPFRFVVNMPPICTLKHLDQHSKRCIIHFYTEIFV